MKSKLWRAAILAFAVWAWKLEAAPRLKYVVIVTRHGVRSPTWDAARLNQYSAQPWPDWGVPPGYLTSHGRKLAVILGSYYREWLTQEHLLGSAGCGDRGRLYIWADTDQRTLETGRALAESLLPGCGFTIHSRREGEPDPLFSGTGSPNPVLAAKAVLDRLGAGPQKLLADHRAALDTLQFILTGGQPPSKKLIEPPAEMGVLLHGKLIDLSGPFAVGSTLSENLLLEYANGRHGAELGWGRLTEANLFQALELHRSYADLMRRTPYLARVRGSNLLAHVLASIEQAVSGKTVAGALGQPETALLILSGHDTNLSNISGMLGLSWALPGYQPDETPPGGALILSLWRDPQNGQLFVRTQYTAQTLDQMRNADVLSLTVPPANQAVSIPGCETTSSDEGCTWPRFKFVLQRAIDRSRIDFRAFQETGQAQNLQARSH